MIRARRRRIVSVIGSDHEKVVLTESVQDTAKLCIEVLECVSKTLWIIPMTVEHVKVHKVCHQHPGAKIAPLLQNLLYAFGIRLSMDLRHETAASKQIIDLSNAHGGDVALHQEIEQCWAWWFESEISPIRSPDVASSFFSHERPRNNSSSGVFTYTNLISC